MYAATFTYPKHLRKINLCISRFQTAHFLHLLRPALLPNCSNFHSKRQQPINIHKSDQFQLLGEEMYSTKERDYPKRGSRNLRSEHSSRSASPDMSRADNLGYEDSLDVAFEHNNKLRDKIQQRMRESESLIASTFGQKSSNEIAEEHRPKNDEQEALRNTYAHSQDQGQLTGANLSNGSYNNGLHVRDLQEQAAGKINVDSSGFKSKMNSALGGLLDKALSNLLHSNGKHDHK